MSRRLVLDWLICTVVLMLAYAARGELLAWLLQGRYPWTALWVDVLALGLLIGLFRAFDFGLRVLFQRLLNKRRQFAADVARFVIVFALAAPFLMTLAQVHPQQIACGLRPSDLGMAYEDVSLTSDGLNLSAWHISSTHGDDRPVVILAHGVGANKQNLLGTAARIHQWGYHVLLLDFRAHGDSAGWLSTLGQREAEDVRVALAWLRERHPGQPICGLGYSMGAAALVEAAAAGSLCDGYVLDSTYARLENSARHSMASYYFPAPLIEPMWQACCFWGGLVSGADLRAICPEEHIGCLAGKRVLFIHGRLDATTPCADSAALHARADSELWLVERAGHLQALLHPDYYPRLEQFLAGRRSL